MSKAIAVAKQSSFFAEMQIRKDLFKKVEMHTYAQCGHFYKFK